MKLLSIDEDDLNNNIKSYNMKFEDELTHKNIYYNFNSKDNLLIKLYKPELLTIYKQSFYLKLKIKGDNLYSNMVIKELDTIIGHIYSIDKDMRILKIKNKLQELVIINLDLVESIVSIK